ncbi:MAG: 5-formyltetrahydrofolate cyclo-ligase [Coriobacteriales bacterium]|jgi:5-formyltetrahydrofolate cyclo-ligase|nr:5-formyltetrahydrofolate cyclo-ligase [Coriobacteriales bacterium]
MTDLSLNSTAQKQQLRAALLAQRNAEDAGARAAADARIKTHLESLPLFQEAQSVFCYLSMGSEVDTRSLIESLLARGKTVCLPRCQGNGIMLAHAVYSLDHLETGALGIPAPAESCPVLEPGALDLIIVPCVACDSFGYRIGYGGGYYDRYLAAAKGDTGAAAKQPVTVALCRESNRQAALPVESHDLPVDVIVTDAEIIQPRPKKL